MYFVGVLWSLESECLTAWLRDWLVAYMDGISERASVLASVRACDCIKTLNT